MSCAKCDKDNQTRRILEDIQDRACKEGLPTGMSLTEFTDYIRGLYPELYVLTAENKEFSE